MLGVAGKGERKQAVLPQIRRLVSPLHLSAAPNRVAERRTVGHFRYRGHRHSSQRDGTENAACVQASRTLGQRARDVWTNLPRYGSTVFYCESLTTSWPPVCKHKRVGGPGARRGEEKEGPTSRSCQLRRRRHRAPAANLRAVEEEDEGDCENRSRQRSSFRVGRTSRQRTREHGDTDERPDHPGPQVANALVHRQSEYRGCSSTQRPESTRERVSAGVAGRPALDASRTE